jgi:protein-L-isoaspartate O-methyltransferase
VLAELAGKLYTVEIIDELAQRAVQRLKQEGYTNVEVRVEMVISAGRSTRRSKKSSLRRRLTSYHLR